MLCNLMLVGFVGLAISGCASSQRATAQMSADIAAISSSYGEDIQGKACVEEFKRTMNDPSSFQLAGPLVYDPIGTQQYYGVKWDGGNPRRAIYSAPVRGRNAFGGLILSKMYCHIGINPDGSIAVFRVTS
jgi:hypothetical protein